MGYHKPCQMKYYDKIADWPVKYGLEREMYLVKMTKGPTMWPSLPQ